ncbi:unnamed protein product [Auanema sp. JU1783]|nr:unnamed protein product [Auanema sp. JU1783]
MTNSYREPRSKLSSPSSEKSKASSYRDRKDSTYSNYCQFCMDTTHVTSNCQFARKVAPEEVEAKSKLLYSHKSSSISDLSSNSSDDGQYSDNEMPPPNDLPCLISMENSKTVIALRDNSDSSLTRCSYERNSISSSEESESMKMKYDELKSWVKSLLSLDVVRNELFMNNPLLASEVVKFL